MALWETAQMLRKIEITPNRQHELIKNHQTIFNQTNFNFLSQHNGLRPKKLHLVIGMPSGGKSTLRNTLIVDFLEQNPHKKAFLYLSEESEQDLLGDIAAISARSSALKRLIIFSEQDYLGLVRKTQDRAQFICDKIARSQCDLFVFDNLTTSQLYGNSFSEQDEFCLDLKSKLLKLNTTNLLIAHTSSSIKNGLDGLIDMNDIRGSKTIVNLTEFLYVLQSFKIKNETINTIRIQKNRSYKTEKNFFMLNFDGQKRIYSFDVELGFDEFNTLYQKQNRLTKSKKA